MTDPTPATPDEAVARDFDHPAIVDDTFPYTFGVTPPIVMHRRGRLMMRLVEFEREILSRQQGDTVAARERLAALEHDQWVAWSQNLATSEMLSPERLSRWAAMWVPYADLTEAQKDMDREWADKVLDALGIGADGAGDR